jgi:preprotein translocase subunit SecG
MVKRYIRRKNKMSIFEIIAGALLLVASIFIIITVLMQEHKNNLSSVTGTASQDSYYGKNKYRTKEARLALFTKIAAIAFFVLALAVNLFGVLWKK